MKGSRSGLVSRFFGEGVFDGAAHRGRINRETVIKGRETGTEGAKGDEVSCARILEGLSRGLQPAVAAWTEAVSRNWGCHLRVRL